ncbi:hypothetical protein C5167_015413 [Papaver somniferum]|uniref:Uncharacterized protein n=1 Tax=Papaver somniferum TaxID=3469 RepID=A0A4Y7JAA5_PAPSO|nr:hypothetical protein C5167_015413 [Papaver somniferum]
MQANGVNLTRWRWSYYLRYAKSGLQWRCWRSVLIHYELDTHYVNKVVIYSVSCWQCFFCLASLSS